MRPVRVSQTDAGSTAVIPMDIYKHPFAVGMGVTVTGTPNYTVQHTFDDVLAPGFNPAAAKWFAHPTMAALSADADSNYAFPVRGVRLTVNSGIGTATLTLIQAG